MNKALIPLLAIGGLLIVGVGTYMVMNRNTDTVDTNLTEASSTESVTNDDGKFSGTFTDLLALGQNYQCTFSNVDESAGTQTTGTVYIAAGGDRLNGEFVVDNPEGSFSGNVIRDGEYNYVWTSIMQEGAKFKITPETDSLFGEASEEGNTGLNDNTNVDFDCNAWNVDNSKFVPPSGVQFNDLSETMTQIETLIENNSGDQCSACDQLPAGDARNQCLSALNCN